MIKKEEHEYPLVKVIWIDITADSNWKSLSELEKESLPVCVSVGYLYSVKNKITRLFTIKSKLKNVHFTRIESSTQNGIPDVNACKNGSECWLELKCNSAKNLGLSKYQMVWIMNRTKAGGRIFIINRPLSQGAIKIYTGSVVRVSGISDNEPPTLVLGPDKFEWQLLDQLLFPASR
jgi:hypothetical protein